MHIIYEIIQYIIVIMSLSKPVEQKKPPKGIEPEMARWMLRRSAECHDILFSEHKDGSILMSYEDACFTLKCPTNYPNHRIGNFCIEYSDDSLNWLGYVNVYCATRNPATLTKVLSKLDSSFCKYNQEKPVYENMDGDDLYQEEDIINSFDIEISRKKAKLNANMKKCTSLLQLDTSKQHAQMFKGDLPGTIILNEFVSLATKYKDSEKVIIDTVDDNVYHWKLKFVKFESTSLSSSLESLSDKFGYNYMEVDIHFHDRFYPTYPPVIKYIRPRLNKCLMHRLANLKMLQTDYWTPSRGMEFVVSNLHSILNKQADININSSMNDIESNKSGSYLELESHLMKLSAYCDDSEEFDELDTRKYNKVYDKEDTKKQLNKVKSSWASGTGYGEASSTGWDINKYLELEKEKELQIQNILNKIVDLIQTHDSNDMITVFNTIDGSYLVSYIKTILGGASALEMGKKSGTFSIIFTILQNLIREEGIFLFHGKNGKNGIIDILKKLNNNVIKETTLMNSVVKNNDEVDSEVNMMIKSLYEMAKPCYDIYVVQNKDTLNANIQHQIEEKDDNDKYVDMMKPFICDTYPISTSKYRYAAQIEGTVSKSVIKRVSQETSIMSELPLHINASILYRHDETHLRVARVLVTGPKDTPYDSGITIYDVLFPVDYPINPPNINIINNGGKRLNPNLYNAGKVCLSLLGTWDGVGGEKWSAQNSTLFQVLNSIQSLILIEEPYYNEPSYETQRGTPQGKKMSDNYTSDIRLYTMNHSMNDMIEHPETFGGFEEPIRLHFKFKKDEILKICGKWVDEAPYAKKTDYNTAYTRLKENLKNL